LAVQPTDVVHSDSDLATLLWRQPDLGLSQPASSHGCNWRKFARSLIRINTEVEKKTKRCAARCTT